jgi:hypothetical protein
MRTFNDLVWLWRLSGAGSYRIASGEQAFGYASAILVTSLVAASDTASSAAARLLAD